MRNGGIGDGNTKAERKAIWQMRGKKIKGRKRTRRRDERRDGGRNERMKIRKGSMKSKMDEGSWISREV